MDNGRKRYALWEMTKSVSKAFARFGALFFGMYWMGYFLTPEKQRVAQKYQVSQDAVFIAPKPHGAIWKMLRPVTSIATSTATR